MWVDRRGRQAETGIPAGAYVTARLSRLDDRVAFRTDYPINIAIWDFARTTLVRPLGDQFAGRAGWPPDLVHKSFVLIRPGGNQNLHLMRADGSGAVELLVDSEYSHKSHSWTSDGTRLVFSENEELHVMSMDGERVPEPLGIRGAGWEISPRDWWIAYSTDESGRNEIEVRPFPNVDDNRWLVSAEGGIDPRWSPMGDELFYRDLTGRLMSVPVETQTEFVHEAPQVAVDGAGLAPTFQSYDVARGGARFLIVKESVNDPLTQSKIVWVQNWFEELQRLVPVP